MLQKVQNLTIKLQSLMQEISFHRFDSFLIDSVRNDLELTRNLKGKKEQQIYRVKRSSSLTFDLLFTTD